MHLIATGGHRGGGVGSARPGCGDGKLVQTFASVVVAIAVAVVENHAKQKRIAERESVAKILGEHQRLQVCARIGLFDDGDANLSVRVIDVHDVVAMPRRILDPGCPKPPVDRKRRVGMEDRLAIAIDVFAEN